MVSRATLEASFAQAVTGDTCPLCHSPVQEIVRSEGKKSLRKCGSCQVFYTVPAPSLEQSEAYFAEGFVVTPSLNRERVAGRVARSIQERMKAGRILDVGCATGHFLSRFFHGGGWETWGVDLSKPAIIFAAAKNIRLHVGDTRSAKFPTGFFDVVTVLDTFYYFQEPLLELQEFKRILKPDGLLVIEVPLAGARLWRLTTRLGEFLGGGKRALFETNDHLFFYGTESLSRILVESEFVVLEMLPLRSNRQNVMMKDVLYFLYDILSRILWKLSGARVMLGPRLLVLARPR